MKKLLQGKLKYLTLFFAGGLADLAFAPFYFFPVLLVSFPVFFKVLESAISKKQAFRIGFMFGFGYFVFGLYWIANSLLVDASKFAWLIPFSVCGIPFLLSFYTGFFAVYYHFTSRSFGIKAKIILFASLWVVFEFLRTWLFFGFPWNLIGYTGLVSITFSQIAGIGGVYLLSFLVIIITLLPVYYKNYSLVALTVIAVIGSFAFGYVELQAPAQKAQTKKIMIFQPNIEQTLKWEPQMAKMNFLNDVEYVKEQNYQDKDLVIWPESGVPYYLNNQPWIVDILKQVAPDNGVVVTGALRAEGDSRENYQVWNTLYAVSADGIYKYYDKIHLVPFGEFVPFRKYLPIDKITPGAVDFSRGANRDIIKFGTGPSFLSLICYEVIFPEYARSEQSPDVIVNVTNDGWFGNSTGPYQHLAMAQMRAIEEGVPVLRAANTGISAVIGPNGKIITSLGYGKRGIIEANVELRPKQTIYKTKGDIIIFVLILIAMFLILILRKKS